MRRLTLPTDSAVRKDIPLYSGCYTYFPAALAGVAMHSKAGNDKHNPGEPLHHARGKSMDHADCIARHSMDIADFMAHRAVWTQEEQDAILTEANAMCWRSLALSQELHEKFGAPLAPAARLPENRKESVHRAIADATGWGPKDAGQVPSAVLPDCPPPGLTSCQSAHAVDARLTSKREKAQGGVDDPRHFERSDGPL